MKKEHWILLGIAGLVVGGFMLYNKNKSQTGDSNAAGTTVKEKPNPPIGGKPSPEFCKKHPKNYNCQTH